MPRKVGHKCFERKTRKARKHQGQRKQALYARLGRNNDSNRR